MARFTVYHTMSTSPPPVETEALAKIDGEVRPLGSSHSAAELATLMTDADGILVGLAPITAEVINSMPDCKVIVRYGVGVDNVDLDAATEQGVIVAHVPDVHREEVANHTLMLLLAVARTLIPQDRLIREGGWSAGPRRPTPQFYGQTVGLVACGPIAQAFARRAKVLSMRVIGYDPYVDPGRTEAAGIELIPSLADLLEQSDFVSVHAPTTDETRHMIDAAAFAQMKDTAYLVNTARGPVVDGAALVEALQSGAIAGAGLDVHEPEPLPKDSPLRGMENVVLTPHSAYYSDHATGILIRRSAESAVHVLTGHWPRFVANKAVLDRLDLKPCPDPPQHA